MHPEKEKESYSMPKIYTLHTIIVKMLFKMARAHNKTVPRSTKSIESHGSRMKYSGARSIKCVYPENRIDALTFQYIYIKFSFVLSGFFLLHFVHFSGSLGHCNIGCSYTVQIQSEKKWNAMKKTKHIE